MFDWRSQGRSGDWRARRSPEYYKHLTRILGREPTEAEFFGSIAHLEHGTPEGRRAVLESAYDRYKREGGHYGGQGRHYDPAVGVNARWHTLTPSAIGQHAKTYQEIAEGGASRLTQPGQTHFFSPAGMEAYYKRNPKLVSSAVWMDVPGRGRTLVPNWATKAVAAGAYTDVGGEWFLAPNEHFGKEVPAANKPPVTHAGGDVVGGDVMPARADTVPIQTFQPQAAAAAPAGRAAPMMIQDVPSKYKMELAQALMGNKLTANPGTFEMITHALSKGLGTYAGMDQAMKQEALTKQAINALPEQYRALGALDPKNALALMLAEKKESATAARDDRRFDQQTKMLEKQHQDRMEAERERTHVQRAAAVNDAKNWTTTNRGEYQTRTNIVSGEKIVTRKGQVIEHVPPRDVGIPQPDKTPRPVPMGAGKQSYSDGTVPSVPPAVTPPAPAEAAGAPPQQKAELPQVPGIAVEPPAAPGQTQGEHVPTADSKPPPGFTALPDGSIEAPNGRTYKATLEDGTVLPSYFFNDRHLHARDDKTSEKMLEHDLKRDDKLTEKLQESYDAWARVRPLLDQADKAIAENAKTGYRGDVMQTIRNMFSTVTGQPVEGLTTAQLIDGLSNRLVVGVKQGLPGAVSNYEMQQYLKSVINLGNTPEANYMLSRFMRKVGSMAETDQMLEQQWREKRQAAGLPPTLTDGFNKFQADHYKANPVISERDKRLIALANKRMPLADLERFEAGDDAVADAFEAASAQPKTPAEKAAARRAERARRVSTDGTVPKAEAAPAAAPAGGDVIEMGGKKYTVKRDASGTIIDAQEVQ